MLGWIRYTMQPTGIAPDFVRFPTGAGQCTMFNGANTNLQRPVSSSVLSYSWRYVRFEIEVLCMTGGSGVDDDHVARYKGPEIPERRLVRECAPFENTHGCHPFLLSLRNVLAVASSLFLNIFVRSLVFEFLLGTYSKRSTATLVLTVAVTRVGADPAAWSWPSCNYMLI